MELERRIRIIHFPGLFINGGVETFLMNVVRNINHERFQFDFCVPREEKGPYDNELIRAGCHIINIPRIREVGIRQYIKMVKRIISENGPYDVAHIHSAGFNGVYSVLAAKEAGIRRIIYHVHSTSDESIRGVPLAKLYRNIVSIVVKRLCSHYLACSEEAASQVYGHKYLENSEVIILKNGIDLERFKPYELKELLAIRRKYGIPDNAIVVGNASRFVKGKNQEFLIKLTEDMSKKKKFFLLLAGDGPTKSECELLAERLGLKKTVKFLGNLSQEKMPEFYNALDLFLFPSEHEGLGNVVIEAQACGIPCIVSTGVPPVTNIGIGLWQLARHNAVSEWSNLVLNTVGTRIYDSASIKSAVNQCGFNISNSVKVLESIYGYSDGYLNGEHHG